MKLVKSDVYHFNSGCYFPEAFDDLDKLTATAEAVINYFNVKFDSMVGMGLSGHLMLPVLARHFDVPFLALRKSNVNSHDSYGAGAFGRGTIGRHYLIIDDFVSSGETIAVINNKIKSATSQLHIPFTPRYVGTYGYGRFSGIGPGVFIDNDLVKHHVKAIMIDDEAIYVDGKLYNYMFRMYGVCSNNSPDPKGAIIAEAIRADLETNVDLLASVAVAVENEYLAEL